MINAKKGKIYNWLLENGFVEYHGDEDYDCTMRVHAFHYLLWSSNLKHFSIAILNQEGKKGPAGTYKKWNAIMLPKPIYTTKEAQQLIESISVT